MRKKDSAPKLFLIYAFLIVWTVGTLYPAVRVITISLRPTNRLLSTSLAVIPEGATFANYINLFTSTPFLRWMLNSLIVTSVVTVSGVALASMAGFAMSKFRFAGKKAVMQSLLTTQMFPATMLLLPMFIMLAKLGLVNSYLGLMIAYSATALPFCIWQMKGYYDTIPTSLIESARVDGCGNFGAWWRVILPLAAPALVITALFSFMASWNEYVVAAVILQEPNMFTLPVGLKMFQGNMSTQWGLYAAGSFVVSVPVVILFIVLSRWLVGGLTLGSVKG
ncbi:MAG TPA: ABC transporter permease subunit [candidate division Zixibacteria bacterium]|nr:ABC transporter permease subunit [candidate division Zixibacteria bacterium]